MFLSTRPTTPSGTAPDHPSALDARPATAGELAAVYAALARTAPQLSAAAPAVVFAGIGAGPALVERLHRFGVDVHVVEEPGVGGGAYVLGGAAHATCIPAGAGEHEHAALVAAIVEQARMRTWAGDAGPEPRFTTMHTPGSDSRGVVQFRLGDAEIVAKIGAVDAIAGEARFAREVNALMAAERRRGLFPQVHGLRLEGPQGVSLMEAGEPLPIDPLFADPERTTLADDAADRLQPHLDELAVWYRLTARSGRPTVVDYLYRERYHVLREHPDFVATFAALFGDVPLQDALDVPVELPGGLVVPGYGAAVGWLEDVGPRLLPDHGSAVHGDIYAANMLLRADGSPMLIDPRTVWEGRDRPDVGYGDPVFDLATLLHGVLPMAAILRAAHAGTSSELFGARPWPGGATLDLSSLRLPVDFPAAVGELERRMLRSLPHDEPLRDVRTRLYVGAATSLAGWLKYPRAMRTPQAWLATLAYVAWYLWQARNVWEQPGSNGRQDS
ncbi:MAG: hypothetical protein QOG56_131 [Solirubrobacteraceae bacterium]|jgi:hypothetical protein|nr:hypothetical protein [Solirubrobacteraceae bacterium]